MENEFPPNSRTRQEPDPSRKTEKVEPKSVSRITRGKVVQRKKPMLVKFKETFFTGADSKGVFEYVILDVIVPGAKDIIADAATTGIERKLFGDEQPRSRRGSRDGYTQYNRMGNARPGRDRDRDRERDDRRPSRKPDRSSADQSQFILDSRVEAEEVLESLFELVSKYDQATVRDFLSLVGERHTTTDDDWGWTDLRGARIHKVRGGYLLDMPRPEALD